MTSQSLQSQSQSHHRRVKQGSSRLRQNVIYCMAAGRTRSGVYSSIIASYPPYFFLHKHKHFCWGRKGRSLLVGSPLHSSDVFTPSSLNCTFLVEFNKISDCFTFLLTLSAQREKPRQQHTTLTSLYGVDGPAAPRREVSTESKLMMFSTM